MERMIWEKKGRIFKAEGHSEWMNSHTTPIAAISLEERIRIFFSCRSRADKQGNFISYVGSIDVDMHDPLKVLEVSERPYLELGKPGTFDEYGTMVAKPVVSDNQIYLYYMGWQRLLSPKAPYQVALGLAISSDGGKTFQKVSDGPILGIDHVDPISIGNVSVIKENGKWHIWYTSLLDWSYGGVKPTPDYNIKYAVSEDGINWVKSNKVVIDKDENGGVATPSVFEKDGIYHMYFGYRMAYEGDKIGPYKIGYAYSHDLMNWTRRDNLSTLKSSNEGWDSEMVCYPHVIKVQDDYLMFYCGNKFGEDGLGLATLTSSK